jgi:hypothetical protein
MKNCCLLLLLLAFASASLAQDSLLSSPVYSHSAKPINYTKRKWIVAGTTALSYGISLFVLDNEWNSATPRKKFYTQNDWKLWLQMDKAGHAWTTYRTSRTNTEALMWAGLSRSKATWMGTGIAFTYMLGVEYLGAHAENRGWSWMDCGANFFGAALFASQELGWKEQRITFKFSAHVNRYADPQLQARADQLFGSSTLDKIFKDYNGQTYWLSFNLKSFLPKSRLPAWLNVAVGYGAEGMFGATRNVAFKNGEPLFDRRDVLRYRQWYLAPDVELRRIRTKSKLLKAVFNVVDCIKFPAPAIEFSNGSFKFVPLAF